MNKGRLSREVHCTAHFLERKVRPLGETYSNSVRPLGLGRLSFVHPSPNSGSGDSLCTRYALAACLRYRLDVAFHA